MKRTIALLALLSALQPAFAQRLDTLVARYDVQAEYLSPEKLYLHMDRTAFHAGETIWFSGYLTDASSRTLLDPSNYIYVELLRSDGALEKRVKIKRAGDSFPGHLDLREDMASGRYTLRAYTLWQMNSSDEYMFNQQVTIFAGKAKKDRESSSKAEQLDISFYPEGGRWFAGMPANIGFKAMDGLGRSVEVSGHLEDADGNVLAKASTIHDGMGLIRFFPDGESVLHFVTDDGRKFPVPALSHEGVSVTTVDIGSKRMVRVQGPACGHYTLVLRDISSLRHVADMDTDGTPKTLALPSEDIRPGINSLMLLDAAGRTVSERLFFKYDDQAAHATLSTLVRASGTRTPIKLALDLKDADGAPLDGTCSVSVLRSSLADASQDDGIDSYMQLSSELRGKINDPRYYFDPSVPLKERAAALDLLMMIQGWSYYDMGVISDPASLLGQYSYAREHMQYLRGEVKRPLSNRAPRRFSMLVMVPKLGVSRFVSVEEGSRFVMDSLDFEEGTGFMIKVKREGSESIYRPTWDGEPFAQGRRYDPAPGLAGVRSEPLHVEYDVVTDTLEAAVLTAESANNVLGINGTEIPRSSFKDLGAMRFMDFVRMKAPAFEYSGGIMTNRRNAALNSVGMHTTSDAWDQSPVKLVVDGAVEPWEGFESLTMGEIETISISHEPDLVFDAREGVVAITLQYGTRVSAASEMFSSMLYFTPLGWQSPQKFYAPRYDRGDVQQEPDKRNTIHWDAGVKVASGHAEFDFCTSDDDDSAYLVCVEGMTSDGRPFSVVTRL